MVHGSWFMIHGFLFCRCGTVLDNQAAGHAKVIHHLVGEGPHQGEDNGVNTRHHQLGALGREGEKNPRGENKEQKRRENEHKRVHFW